MSNWLLGTDDMLTIPTLVDSRTNCAIFTKLAIVKFTWMFHIIILEYGILEHLLIWKEVVHHGMITFVKTVISITI